jgi:hypothetical protein
LRGGTRAAGWAGEELGRGWWPGQGWAVGAGSRWAARAEWARGRGARWASRGKGARASVVLGNEIGPRAG